jgi:hypothetical protein
MDAACAAKVTPDLASGMAFKVSYWQTQDTWLWKDRCQASACGAKQLLIKNIAV